MFESIQIRYVAFIAAALACLAFSENAFAVSPPPDGGYPNQTTAEGDSALFSLTTGANNTATGFQALYSDTIGRENTAIGAGALFSTIDGSNDTASGFHALFSNTSGAFTTGKRGLRARKQH